MNIPECGSRQASVSLCNRLTACHRAGHFLCLVGGVVNGKILIDRTQLPYDAMVADPSWLGVVEEEKKGDAADGDTETEEIQTNEV